MRPALASLALGAIAVPASAQVAPNPNGCSPILTASTELLQRLMQNPGPAFAFDQLGETWSLSPDAAADKQQVCRTLKQQLPSEDQWQYVNVFESHNYYVAIVMLHDPDPTDDIVVLGLTTVAVYTKSDHSRVTAFSF